MFHSRGQGDDAKAGKSRETIRAIFHAPPAGLAPGEAKEGPPAAALKIAEWVRPLASLGVGRNDDSACSKPRSIDSATGRVFDAINYSI
jgi:hypothetical protein